MMTRFRATLAYNGTAYHGYQVQPNVPTVQGEVESALQKIFRQKINVWAAGRTDTGVHATGQVIAFEADWKHPPQALLKALNATLPDDIALQAICEQAEFHPRFDALSRTYRYLVAVVDVRQPLLLKRAWQMQKSVDEAVLQTTARLLIGEHDFGVFGTPPAGSTHTIREVYQSEWIRTEQDGISLYHYQVTATAFLYHMVRRMVGMMIAAGTGKITLAEFEESFKSADLSRCQWIAPPDGLTLISVAYPEVPADDRTRTKDNQNPVGD